MPRINPTHIPRTAITVGALAVATSSVFIDLSGTSPGTSTFYRCLLAMPLVAVPAMRERRSHGSLSGRGVAVALLAGALTAGVSSRGVTGTDPLLGTIHGVAAALCYAGFLYLLRRGGMGGLVIQPYLWVITSAALVGLIIGMFWRGADLPPGWQAFGWLILIAVLGQSIGWLLVAIASPRLPSTVSAALLLFTPVGALLLSALATGERPSATQLAGAALVLAGAYVASTGGHGRESRRGRSGAIDVTRSTDSR